MYVCVPCMSLCFFVVVIFQLVLEVPKLCLLLLPQAGLTGFVQEKFLEIYTSFSEQKCLGVLQGFNLGRITVSWIYICQYNLADLSLQDKNLERQRFPYKSLPLVYMTSFPLVADCMLTFWYFFSLECYCSEGILK